jgi:hypothetical protein
MVALRVKTCPTRESFDGQSFEPAFIKLVFGNYMVAPIVPVPDAVFKSSVPFG